MANERLASIDLGLTNYEARTFHSKSVGDAMILNGYIGHGITIGATTGADLNELGTTTTDIDDKANHRIIAINDGSWVFISGANFYRTDNSTFAANTWMTFLRITLDNTSASNSANLELLRPHPGVVAFVDEAGGAGILADPGIAPASELICGTCYAATGAAVIGAGTGGSAGVVRILPRSATVFDIQGIFGAALTDAGTLANPTIAFTLRYPAAPVSRGYNLA